MPPLSFRVKLALWAALLGGVALLVFVAASAAIVYDNMLEEADFQLKANAEKVFSGLESGTAPPQEIFLTLQAAISAEEAPIRVIRLMHWEELLHADLGWPVPDNLPYRACGSFETIRHQDQSWRVPHQTPRWPAWLRDYRRHTKDPDFGEIY